MLMVLGILDSTDIYIPRGVSTLGRDPLLGESITQSLRVDNRQIYEVIYMRLHSFETLLDWLVSNECLHNSQRKNLEQRVSAAQKLMIFLQIAAHGISF